MSCESSFVRWVLFTEKMPFSSQRLSAGSGSIEITALVAATLERESRRIPLLRFSPVLIFRVPGYSESEWRSSSVLGSVGEELGILKQRLKRPLSYRRH